MTLRFRKLVGKVHIDVLDADGRVTGEREADVEVFEAKLDDLPRVIRDGLAAPATEPEGP